MNPDVLESILRLLAASALGGLIGLEREHHGRSAGLRTHLLVSLGSALAMLVSLHFGSVYGNVGSDLAVRIDPARVAYGVMTGVGFLGAGVIIHYGLGVRGMTTGASLWCSAAIGLAAGFGMYSVAAAATAMVLFALVVLDWVDKVLPVRQTRNVTVRVPDVSIQTVGRLSALLREGGGKVTNVTYSQDFRGGQATITFSVSAGRKEMDRAVDALRRGTEDLLELKVE